MITTAEKLRRISRIIKKKFTNLTVDETLEIAAAILDELEKP